jgi:hypothetical protein
MGNPSQQTRLLPLNKNLRVVPGGSQGLVDAM